MPAITARWSLSSITFLSAGFSPGHMNWKPALSMIRIRLFQILDRAQHHAGRDADVGRIVDAKKYDLLQETIT
jgi:hypothetical protein